MEEKATVRQPQKSRRLFYILAVVLCAVLFLSFWFFSHRSAPPLTVSDTNYSFTVESADLDGEYAYLLLTVKALNEDSMETLMSPHFGYGLGFFSLQVPDLEPRAGYVFDQNSPGVGQISVSLLSQTEDSRTILLEPQLTAETDQLEIRLELMEENFSIIAPLTNLPSVTVDIGATGIGAPNTKTGELTSFRLQNVTLTPMGCTLNANLDSDAQPRLFFRMADGSLRTSAQMCSTFRQTFGSSWYWRCRFQERQELKDISSVIVFDTEYPLDGSAPFSIDHDPTLDPVTVPRGEALFTLADDDYVSAYIPLRLKPLMEALGGTYEEDSATGKITCTYRGETILFDPAAQEITKNGTTQSTQTILDNEASIPFSMQGIQNGEPMILFALVSSTWQLDGFAIHSATIGPASEFGDWYVIP